MSTSNEIFALLNSPEIDNDYDKLQSLIDSDPLVLLIFDDNQRCPLHIALTNPHITLRIIKLLLRGWPESISMVNGLDGNLPIHLLCSNKDLDEAVSVDILSTLIEESPESVQREASDGGLPIHKAARWGMSPEFLKILVQAHPESVGIQSGDGIPGANLNGSLPIHLACSSDNCRVDTVKYLLDVHPESIDVDSGGWLPIHIAADSNGPQKADIIEHLLMKDPDCASKATEDGHYPLHLACYANPDLSAMPDLASVQLLFNAYPEAILKRDVDGNTPLKHARMTEAADVIVFIEAQLVYAEKSQDVSAMTTLDQNDWLPLHHALKNNTPLGSIKLLVKGCSLAIRVPDNNMAFPLQLHASLVLLKLPST